MLCCIACGLNSLLLMWCVLVQTLAEQYSVRVTFMSGDVHVGAYGCFQAHPKQHLRVVDPKFMMQVGLGSVTNQQEASSAGL
jgi:hypothetical protein